MDEITYRYGNDLDLDQVIELYHASTLGERRPVDDRAIMEDMLGNANLVVTAWDGALLVGIARTLTDFTYVGYLADLAVHASYQRKGIGIELIAKEPCLNVILRPFDVLRINSAEESRLRNSLKKRDASRCSA